MTPRALTLVVLPALLALAACEPSPAQNTMCRGLTVPNAPFEEQPQTVQLLMRAGLCPRPVRTQTPNENVGLPIDEIVYGDDGEFEPEPEPDAGEPEAAPEDEPEDED